MWVKDCPRDDVGGHGPIRLGPVGGVLHRSYGQYPGDYAVIAASGLAHFLVGKNPGEWVQFIDTTQVAWHCGSNWWGVGVEFTGVNEDVLTDWQVSQGRLIIEAVSAAHGIPLTYSDGSEGWVTPPIYGWHAHNHIIPDGGGDQHTDLVTPADWTRMIAPAPVTPRKDSEMFIAVGQIPGRDGEPALLLDARLGIAGDYGSEDIAKFTTHGEIPIYHFDAPMMEKLQAAYSAKPVSGDGASFPTKLTLEGTLHS